MQVYHHPDYKDLAEAVKAGMPMDEAEKILAQQRDAGGKGEEKFWLVLKGTDEITTIQLTRGTKEKLEALKEGRDTFEDVIIRLVA